jgi:hypothetical protein
MRADRFEKAKVRVFVRREILMSGEGISISYRAKIRIPIFPAAIRAIPFKSGMTEKPYMTARTAIP